MRSHYFLMIALIACGTDSTSKKDAVNTIQDTVENKFQRVDPVSDTIRRTRMEYQVFEPNKLDWVYFGNTYSATNITNEDLLMIEQIIDSFILSNHSAKRLSRETLGKYRYQITGAESGDQNKKAFIQAICTEMAAKDNWKKND